MPKRQRLLMEVYSEYYRLYSNLDASALTQKVRRWLKNMSKDISSYI